MMNFSSSFLIRLLTAAALAAPFGAALAYPTRPITIIVPFNPGTTNDVNARDFAQVLSAAASEAVERATPGKVLVRLAG